MPQSTNCNPQSAIKSVLCIGLSLIVNSALAAEPVPPEHAAKMKQGLAVFQKHVRPVLLAKCVKCHGGEKVKSGFNLATREGLIKGGDLEEGVVVGKSQESYLLKVIRHEEEPHMPAGGKKLPDAEIARIAEWIDLGAPYDKPLVEQTAGPRKLVITEEDRNFWSFRPLAKVAPAKVKQNDWVQTPIDRFILARLEAKGLRPNPIADRRKLIRRAYFSLLGLPPSPEEVETFVNDPDPKAFETLVDQLLESPQYGERWARHWMDLARFAESHGYEQDYDRPHAYHYRDFLIKAFNDDLPYDEFVRWQLAGDEIAPDNPLAMMATGFLGAGAFPTQLTEVEFESARYDELDDMISTTGTAVLGLTVGCARCHSHKYDPIPNQDYYRLIATFATTIRSEVELDMTTDGDRQRLAVYEARHRALQSALKTYEQQELPGKLKAWLTANDPQAEAHDGWTVAAFTSHTSSGGTKYALQSDGSLLATGKPPAKEDITLVFETADAGITALRLEALTHESLPQKGPGRADNGNFALGDFRVQAAPLDGNAKPVVVALADARATHQQDTGSLSVKASIDDNPVSGWAVDRGGIGKNQSAVFEFAKPVGASGGTRFTVTLRFQHPNKQHSLGRFRLSYTQAARPVSIEGPQLPPAKVRQGLVALKQDWDANQKYLAAVLPWFGQRHDAGWQQRQANLAAHAADRPQPRKVKAQITSEGVKPMKHHADGRGFPHFYPQVYYLERGDVNQKKDIAPAGFLQVLLRDDESHWKVEPSANAKTSGRRTALANWLTDPENGAGNLAARVMANRLWYHHFGTGIVATPSDFGFQGERPTHPELLDWLAGQLIAGGWHLKPIHRLILLSSVYQQTGDFDEDRAKVDRENRLLWRRTPHRLEAEAIRDSMLSVAGMLDPTMYGPGTLDENMRRRSVYFFIKRSKLIPSMMLFDWPEHLVGIGRRGDTTIAPQALEFMNSPHTRKYAEGLASRVVPAPDRPLEQSIRSAYLIALGRPVRDDELALAGKFIAAQASRYRDSGKGNADHLALVDFCQTLLSLNEFVYID